MENQYKFIIILVFAFTLACNSCNQPIDIADLSQNDLGKIMTSKKLTVFMDYNTTGYFIHKGQKMGFQYELLSQFCKEMNIKLEVHIKSNMNDAYRLLNNGECDLLAYNLPVTPEREKVVAYTLPHSFARQVIVQRKQRTSFASTTRSRAVNTPLDLIGKTVHVRNGSAQYFKIYKLSEAFGGEINVTQDAPETDIEELIRKVARGEIDITIAESNVAKLYAKQYSNLDVNIPISTEQGQCWAVHKDSKKFLQVLNKWIEIYTKTDNYKKTYAKYYHKNALMEAKKYHVKYNPSFKHISKYDSLIKHYANNIGWDWRLVASVVRHESGFNPTAVSNKGAFGLMQLLPSTALQFGVTDLGSPVENLRAGTNYLLYLDRFWRKHVPDPKERIKFVIGSYNAGHGHVMDAVNLAMKYEKDSAIWDENVAYFLLKKSEPEFYKDNVIKHGYCRGQEPIKYVANVLHTFELYKQKMN